MSHFTCRDRICASAAPQLITLPNPGGESPNREWYRYEFSNGLKLNKGQIDNLQKSLKSVPLDRTIPTTDTGTDEHHTFEINHYYQTILTFSDKVESASGSNQPLPTYKDIIDLLDNELKRENINSFVPVVWKNANFTQRTITLHRSKNNVNDFITDTPPKLGENQSETTS